MNMSKITIAINNMDAMVAFYNAVFNCNLNAIPETPFYAGTLFGQQLIFCPNFIAEVKAEKNRIQFDVMVDDIKGLVEIINASGGSTMEDTITETDTALMWGITDPDGNSFSLVQLK